MSQQIIFYEKNKIDLANPNPVLTVTDGVATNTGQDFVNFLRNRSNDTAWITTGSNDSANTQLDVQFIDFIFICDILMLKHNFKDFTIQYHDGVSYVDFSTPINVSGNTEETNYFSFDQVNTDRIRIIIQAAQVVDADKFMHQLIVTEKLGVGQLQGWPIIKNPTLSTNKKINQMLSGKVSIVENIKSASMSLDVRNWNIDADLTLVETIYFLRQGVLISMSGGDETQFSHQRQMYRKEDVFLVRPVNEYKPEWFKGLYKSGMKIKIDFRESID